MSNGIIGADRIVRCDDGRHYVLMRPNLHFLAHNLCDSDIHFGCCFCIYTSVVFRVHYSVFGRSTSDLNGRQRNQFRAVGLSHFQTKDSQWNETERFMRCRNKSIALISRMPCIHVDRAQIWKLKLKMRMHGPGADGENQAIARILKQKHL